MIGPLRHEAGFTLVELLVSLALLSMAAVLIVQSFSVDRGALLRLQARTSTGEEIEAAQDLIRSRVEHLFAQTHFDSSGPSVQMDGASDHLEFLASSPNLLTPIQRYRLSLSPGGDLDLAGQTTGGGSASSSDPALLHNVQRLEISYYGPSGTGQAHAWSDDWSNRTTPPELVRVRLSFNEKDRHVWPDLIMRPGVTVDTACVLDPETSLCRGRQ